ncbi:MAG: phosphopantetheine-binding protein [Actinomycetota bacterium]
MTPPHPVDQLEQILLLIWSDVLETEVGLDDDFFELGGDSLRSMRIAANAAEVGISISPVQVFEERSVRALARVADLEVAPNELEAALGALQDPSRLSDTDLERLSATLMRGASQAWRGRGRPSGGHGAGS